ncbi:hypothetical protein LWI28_015103 [Acer negundo]|uniref:Uncharacterized protein n=1 Tax=Acer negundo TaxID=4023 RepID=A0AAD5IJE6_ACENE|nr:hypothetical protein LWI28_015103 [Acer negundo]
MDGKLDEPMPSDNQKVSLRLCRKKGGGIEMEYGEGTTFRCERDQRELCKGGGATKSRQKLDATALDFSTYKKGFKRKEGVDDIKSDDFDGKGSVKEHVRLEKEYYRRGIDEKEVNYGPYKGDRVLDSKVTTFKAMREKGKKVMVRNQDEGNQERFLYFSENCKGECSRRYKPNERPADSMGLDRTQVKRYGWKDTIGPTRSQFTQCSIGAKKRKVKSTISSYVYETQFEALGREEYDHLIHEELAHDEIKEQHRYNS